MGVGWELTSTARTKVSFEGEFTVFWSVVWGVWVQGRELFMFQTAKDVGDKMKTHFHSFIY